jgi:hypothetical protein
MALNILLLRVAVEAVLVKVLILRVAVAVLVDILLQLRF